ncbi:hypothetical protein [Sorangium sp. So ce385]|uniref:hypothetical protein n=1 Tax=Sorangium sp. So ce385 TaxID=3133308 RepID=UPI003F5C8B41
MPRSRHDLAMDEEQAPGTGRITELVPGAPFQPRETVHVVDAVDREIHDVARFIGSARTVVYLSYDTECGQSYPADPRIGVRLDTGAIETFWPEELSVGLHAQQSDRAAGAEFASAFALSPAFNGMQPFGQAVAPPAGYSSRAQRIP